MPQFNEHIRQAEHNLQFLECINRIGTTYCDWQVTTCFYTAVHLVNAHLSNFDMQYRKHVDVKDALNPRNLSSETVLPVDEYLAYTKLQSLSRRSRYLVNEKDGNLNDERAFLTYDIHLKKALKHLNTIINYFSSTYRLTFPGVKIVCEGVNKGDLSFARE